MHPRQSTGFSSATELSKLPEGMHADRKTTGLYAQIRRSPRTGKVGASWLFRWKPRGQGAKTSRVLGLGPLDLSNAGASLDTARKLASQVRDMIARGLDPVEERERMREDEARKLRKRPTFREYASEYVRRREGEWKNATHRQQWRNTLGIGGAGKAETNHCASLHGLRIDKIDRAAIVKVLDPIWSRLPETASRLRGRLERILDAAKADGYRTGDNPAAWRGNLDTRYSPKGKIREIRHHPALAWQEVPGLVARLAEMEGVAPRCVLFILLTAARSIEARGMVWEELDEASARWVIPRERMKRRKAHAVPLSKPAIGIVKKMPRMGPFVFPGLKKGTGISDTSLRNVLRDLGYGADDASIHGLRSSFRDWCAEATNYPREAAEHALAHRIPDAAERAYFRSDLFAKRVSLMQEWANFCFSTGKGDRRNHKIARTKPEANGALGGLHEIAGCRNRFNSGHPGTS